MQIVQRKIEDLIPYVKNSRTHSEDQIAQIAASIKEFGWTNSDYANITAVFQFVYAISMLFAGRVIDKLGTKVGYIVAIVIWSIGAIMHAYAAALPDVMGISARDAILPVVPMFHVNAWGIPYSAALTGAKLVFPGSGMDGKSIYELIEGEGVTYAAGVPTVWQMLLTHMKSANLKFSTLNRTVIGGSACPPAMIDAFRDDYGIEVLHAWGMTELSPLGTLCTLKNKHLKLPAEEQMKIRLKQGRAIFGIDMKIVDDAGNEQPHDGKAYGDLLVRGPWVVSDYYKAEGGSPLVKDAKGQSWFPTGDVATIDPDGYMQITDRSKDVIKSGGEWISSIDIENIAVAHPAVLMAACIGVKHPKWDERPIVAVVKKPDGQVTREELLAFYEGKTAKWQIPDDVVFVDSIPLGATGKMLKTKLREQLKDYVLPTLEMCFFSRSRDSV